MAQELIITKASGEKQPFVRSKLHQSLVRVGASESLANEIVNEIEGSLVEGMSTKSIYKKAHKLLSLAERPVAARYDLKNAIMQLGPSGYPFEKYIGAILKHQGYQVQVSKVVAGHCVNHEVDVIAEKDEHHFMIECKYHNQSGIFCDVKIPLYIHSRFKDVEAKWKEQPGHSTKFHQGWVVTNTRFTKDAVQYGSCSGMKLMSWDYPLNEGLKDVIDKMGLYPVTCLTTLTKTEKQQLLKNKVVLCKEICNNKNHLSAIGVTPSRIKSILNEGHQLCTQLISDGKHEN
jgi:hypothetical protein